MLYYIYSTPTLQNQLDACLITFATILRVRTGLGSVQAICEKDLALVNGQVHFSPPASRSESSGQVNKRAKVLQRALQDSSSINHREQDQVNKINAVATRRPKNLSTRFSIFVRAY